MLPQVMTIVYEQSSHGSQDGPHSLRRITEEDMAPGPIPKMTKGLSFKKPTNKFGDELHNSAKEHVRDPRQNPF